LTPLLLWRDAADLGRRAHQKGRTVAAMDLLIAAAALQHGVKLVTFDRDFAGIARVSALRLHLLDRT
jgi:predicted nucleic acid-binding protein